MFLPARSLLLREALGGVHSVYIGAKVLPIGNSKVISARLQQVVVATIAAIDVGITGPGNGDQSVI